MCIKYVFRWVRKKKYIKIIILIHISTLHTQFKMYYKILIFNLCCCTVDKYKKKLQILL